MTKSAYLISAIQATLAVLVLVGILHLTAEQLGAIVLALTTWLAAVAAWLDPRVPFGNTSP